MSDLVLPEVIANQLQGLPHPVHLCNAAGKTLGYFVPAADASDVEELGPDLSPEELRHIEQSCEWYSTDEVLRQLEKLD
jgi:hypothetical protein